MIIDGVGRSEIEECGDLVSNAVKDEEVVRSIQIKIDIRILAGIHSAGPREKQHGAVLIRDRNAVLSEELELCFGLKCSEQEQRDDDLAHNLAVDDET